MIFRRRNIPVATGVWLGGKTKYTAAERRRWMTADRSTTTKREMASTNGRCMSHRFGWKDHRECQRVLYSDMFQQR